MRGSLRRATSRRHLLAALAACLLIGGFADAGITLRSPTGTLLRWDLDYEQPNVVLGEVTYYVSPAGSVEEPPGDVSERDAVDAAFNAWENTQGTRIAFREDVSRWAVDTHIEDRINLITWEQFRLGPFTLAISLVNSSDGIIKDTDIVFNDTQQLMRWATTTPGSPGYADVQSVATHEIGHLIGLDHSPSARATMGSVQPVGSIHGRSLEPDDVSALREAYPGSLDLETGILVGTVRIGKRKRKRGVAVFALEAESGEVAGSALTDDDGVYRIRALPPGPYRVVATPLAQPGVVSAWWAKAPLDITATPLPRPGANPSVPDMATVRAGFPTVVPDFAVRKAKKRGFGEPDNDPARARELLVGATQAGAFENALDEDWFVFRVTDTNAVDLRLRAWGMGSISDAEMALFEADGLTEIHNSIDTRAPLFPEFLHGEDGIDLDAAILGFRPPAPGEYRVRARVQPQSEAGGPEAFYYIELLPSARVADAAQTAALLADAAVRAGSGAQAILSVTPRNVHGLPLGAGAVVRAFRTDGGGGQYLDDVGDGTYVASITAPTSPGAFRYSISIETEDGTVTLGDAVQVIAAGPVDSVATTLTALPRRLEPDGLSTTLLTLRPRDAAGRPLGPGLDVDFAFDGASAGTLGVVEDVGDGNYTTTLTAPSSAGRVYVTASLDGAPIGTSSRVAFGWDLAHVLPDVGGDLGDSTGLPGLSRRETRDLGKAGAALDKVAAALASGDDIGLARAAAQAVAALDRAGSSPRFTEGREAARELAESLRRRVREVLYAIAFSSPDPKGERLLGKAKSLYARAEYELLLRNTLGGAKLLAKAMTKARRLLQ